ncbi:ribonuclease catalytic domain-containing protein [Pseudodesulfovibrio tunisiensis]|uniref:ribonuclease catalytic domain-containing protein n=1 Tax=Pseudodesulfovibrio tunisiensis TaxID=463192 RepID=UPI001FB2569E|nr:ribonuclease catalytic domain-containing protein [Pseudodesulfovibrio tunisiensis]
MKATFLSPTARPGSVVEFMHGDQPQLAWVLEEASGKLRLWTINKRETKLPAARLLPWGGPVYSNNLNRQEIQDKLNAHQEKRGEIQASINVMELWDLAQGEMESAPLTWFADLLWDTPGPDHFAALGRAMLSAKTHFKFRPPEFEIWPEEKVQERMAKAAEEKEREGVIAAGQKLFKPMWNAHLNGAKYEAPTMEPELAKGLETLLRNRIADNLDDNGEKIWTAVSKGLPEHPHLALLLAQTWGVLPRHHNFHLDLAGYAWGDDWSESFSNEIDSLKKALSNETPEIDPTPFISIDSATTRDIDDAFAVETLDTGWKLSIALARPVAHWEFGAELDQAVFHRATSLYLPEGTGHMMPETLGTELYSLIQGLNRPALVTDFWFDRDGALLRTAPRLTWVNISANITYEEAEERIRSGSDKAMCAAHDLAAKLLEHRLRSGACVIRKPEPIVKVEGEGAQAKVDIRLKQPCTASELLISEFMILTNNGLANWARDNNVPLLHRTQAIALPVDAVGIFTEPAEILRTVKLLLPPTLETTPKRHAALGVDAYAPISSPLRRYTDFINMAQVQSFLETGEPRLDKEELDTLATHLGIRIQSVSQVQRFRPRYWKLVYLAAHKKELRSAVLVDESGPMATLAMPELQINVRLPKSMLGEKLLMGQRFQVRFSRIDPLTNEIRVAEALEE